MSGGPSAQWDCPGFLQVGGHPLWDFLAHPTKDSERVSRSLDVRVSIRNVKPKQIEFPEAHTCRLESNWFLSSAALRPAKMPSTSLDKARKAIQKKKGPIGAIHELSRDSKRLHRARARDEKLDKLAAARKKNDKPYSLCHPGCWKPQPLTAHHSRPRVLFPGGHQAE